MILTILLMTAAIGCRKSSEDNRDPNINDTLVETRQGKVRVAIRNVILWTEIADQPGNRERGLMFRKTMPQDEGMLFIFEYPQMQSFWMKNTYIPLDIAFISEKGVIINILTMEPLNEGPRYRSLAPALYVIETNAGWFERNGIKPGDKVRF
jgi:uncharacterized membrane protein (UPF0127 family)